MSFIFPFIDLNFMGSLHAVLTNFEAFRRFRGLSYILIAKAKEIGRRMIKPAPEAGLKFFFHFSNTMLEISPTRVMC